MNTQVPLGITAPAQDLEAALEAAKPTGSTGHFQKALVKVELVHAKTSCLPWFLGGGHSADYLLHCGGFAGQIEHLNWPAGESCTKEKEYLAFMLTQASEWYAQGKRWRSLGSVLTLVQMFAQALVPVLIGVINIFAAAELPVQATAIALSIIATFCGGVIMVYDFRTTGTNSIACALAAKNLFSAYVTLSGPVFDEAYSPDGTPPATGTVVIPDLTGIDFELLRRHIDNLEAAPTANNSASNMHNGVNFVKIGQEFSALERQYLSKVWMIADQVAGSVTAKRQK